jgi:endoglucanase
MKSIKLHSILLPAVFMSILILSMSCKVSAPEKPINPSGFIIHRGVNLSHWLSQDFGWVPKYTLITEKDIRFIDSIGYDHVRIPIDEMEMWDEEGKPVLEAFVSLSRCLDWCAAYDLNAIIDLHILRAHHFNAGNEGKEISLWTDSSAQQHFIDLWLKLSEFLHSRHNNKVAYELLNEAVAPDPESWNILLNKAIAAIRKMEPDRVLILGCNLWQKPENMPFLKIPQDDKNIILSFHTYSPLFFTHYLANWVPGKDYPGPVHYPGQTITDSDYAEFVDTTNHDLVEYLRDARDTFNISTLFRTMEPAILTARAKQLQLYCGEFGCLPTVDRAERLKYYADIITLFKQNDIAWCNWEYKGDFGIYHFDTIRKVSMQPDTDLIDVLLKN